MKVKNNTWTVIVFSIIAVTILSALLASVWVFIYWLYKQVFDLKDQMYLSVRADSFNNKQLIEYINDPISYNIKEKKYTTKANFEISNNSRYVEIFEDFVVPWVKSLYMMTSFDNESPSSLNKIKKIIVYFNKLWESWDLNLNLIKYNEDFISDMKTGKIELLYSDATICSTVPSYWPESKYKCKYEIKDFNYDFENNVNDYVFFMNSKDIVSYAIEWYDKTWSKVNVPSRYLNLDFNSFTSDKDIIKNTNTKLDIYQKYNLNINISLYNLK